VPTEWLSSVIGDATPVFAAQRGVAKDLIAAGLEPCPNAFRYLPDTPPAIQ